MQGALASDFSADDCLHEGCDLGLFEDDAALVYVIRFLHQQLQEYFAAWTLVEHFDSSKFTVPWRTEDLGESSAEALWARGGDDLLPQLDTTGWEESALIAAGLSKEPDAFIHDLMSANLDLAGRCAAQSDLEISGDLCEQLRKALLARSQNPQADLRARIAAGEALGELGDPRLSMPAVKAGVKVLLPAFAGVSGGQYTVGGDPEGYQREQPAQQAVLSGFELALHPVTNAEYECFVKAGGYQEDSFWPGRALARQRGEIEPEGLWQRVRDNLEIVLDAVGREASLDTLRQQFDLSLADAKYWFERLKETEEEFEDHLRNVYPPPKGPFVQPESWRLPVCGKAAQPVVGVCWHEAQAYCLWLNAMLETARYRLPTEVEWEAAGRGTGKGIRYAWGDKYGPSLANTADTRLGVTTPVGVFPGGIGPNTGLYDMCGNVWEWTISACSEGENWASASSAYGDAASDERRVVRGGSWRRSPGRARLGYRLINAPEDRDVSLGFRLCRAARISTRLLMAVCSGCGSRVRRVARFRRASKSTARLRFGVAAQSVEMAQIYPVCTNFVPSGEH